MHGPPPVLNLVWIGIGVLALSKRLASPRREDGL